VAPEPETLLWAHLEYSKRERLCRSVVVNIGTVGLLLVGAIAIVSSNLLKDGQAYIDRCSQDVLGTLLTTSQRLKSCAAGMHGTSSTHCGPCRHCRA
jgi:hypothetical protein